MATSPPLPALGKLSALRLLCEFTLPNTPRESMPMVVRYLMLLAPNTHFVMLAQTILYRGGGLGAVWMPFVTLAAIGSVLFFFSLGRLR